MNYMYNDRAMIIHITVGLINQISIGIFICNSQTRNIYLLDYSLLTNIAFESQKRHLVCFGFYIALIQPANIFLTH